MEDLIKQVQLDLNKLLDKCNHLEKENLFFCEMIEEKEKKNKDLEEELTFHKQLNQCIEAEYETKNKNSTIIIDDQYKVIANLKPENEKLKKQIEELNTQNEKLKKEIQLIIDEDEQLKIEKEKMENEIKQISMIQNEVGKDKYRLTQDVEKLKHENFLIRDQRNIFKTQLDQIKSIMNDQKINLI
jgi:regulator of replication initiation timing